VPENFFKRDCEVAIKNNYYHYVRFSFDINTKKYLNAELNLLYDILFAGENCKVFQELSNKAGYIYSFDARFEGYNNIGNLYFSFEVQNKNLLASIEKTINIFKDLKNGIKNELDYLKAQINPHALFNSLNTIYGHIDKTNQVARNILLQFSELLRYQLYDCGAEKVNLEKEITYIKNYVGFQRLRKDENLILKVDIEEVEPGLKIAPLLLVVLIENAFKFVSNSCDKENRINIRTYTKNKVLYSSIVNTKDLQQAGVNNSSNGIGLANLKRRLELLYAEKYQLITKVEDNLYKANLIIDLA
jgi:LytS/YehU family sensor histidine kinase